MDAASPFSSGSRDAGGAWSPELEHVLQGTDGDGHLVRPTASVRERSASPITRL
jgi:hypothetical protein